MTISINQDKYKSWISDCGKTVSCVSFKGYPFEIERKDYLHEEIEYHLEEGATDDSDVLSSPMPGKVIKLNAKNGDEVKKGSVVLVIEAMKMENSIVAHKDARIEKISVTVGQMVEAGVPLVSFEQN